MKDDDFDYDDYGVGYTTSQHPPVEDGYVRLYEDHTGRSYKDITEEEYEKIQNSDFMKIFNEEFRKEVDTDIVEKMKEIYQEMLDNKKEL